MVSAAAVANPSLTTTASPNTSIGLQIFDHAGLVGGANPMGTVTFNLFGPGDNACTTPFFTSTVAVAGGSTNSQPFITNQAGTYRWRASYGGDANNAAVTTALW